MRVDAVLRRMTTNATDTQPLDLDAISARAADVYRPDEGWDGYEAERAHDSVVEDVPALVDEVRRLRTENERLTRAYVEEQTLDDLANAAGISGEDRDPARIIAATLTELDRRTANWQRVQSERDEREACVWELGKIIAGRTVPPTDAEIDAHKAAGGVWLYRPDGLHGSTREIGPEAHGLAVACRHDGDCRPGRWWSANARGILCAWPVVLASQPSG